MECLQMGGMVMFPGSKMRGERRHMLTPACLELPWILTRPLKKVCLCVNSVAESIRYYTISIYLYPNISNCQCGLQGCKIHLKIEFVLPKMRH